MSLFAVMLILLPIIEPSLVKLPRFELIAISSLAKIVDFEARLFFKLSLVILLK
jgi:hypothetical protein